MLRALWNYAASSDTTLPPNPTGALRSRWLEVPRRQRVVSTDELPRFFAAIQALDNTVARDYLTLLLFTGLRREEAASLTWNDVDLPARIMRISAARTKAGRKLELPITDFIYNMLSCRHRGLGNTQFVFPSVGKSGHIAEPKFPLTQIALKTGIQVSAHDLRRTFITVAESCDISPIALKALVNHSLNGDVTSGYVIVTPERLREPAQRVTDRLKALCHAT